MKCPGSRDWCSRVQCCPGFAGSNNLIFPCPTASASYNMCQATTRLTDTSACDANLHVTSVTGVKFDVRVRPDSQGTQSLLCCCFLCFCVYIFRGVPHLPWCYCCSPSVGMCERRLTLERNLVLLALHGGQPYRVVFANIPCAATSRLRTRVSLSRIRRFLLRLLSSSCSVPRSRLSSARFI